MEDRKRFSKLQDKATKKGEKDDEKSLSEFMSVTGEVVLYREYVTLSPDNIDNIDEEENQGGDLTQQNEEEGDGDQDDQTAEGKVTSDSHPDSDKEEGDVEDGEDDDDADDEDYNEPTPDEGSQVPSDSEDPLTAKSDAQKPAEAKPLAKRRPPPPEFRTRLRHYQLLR